MGREFALLDHSCSELEKLLEEKRISYEYLVCDCSPLERHYQLLKDGKWKDIEICPFCGKAMTNPHLGRMRLYDPFEEVKRILNENPEIIEHVSVYCLKQKFYI